MAAAATYSFPLMPPAEIATCLGELGLAFSEASLAKPEPEAVAKLFEALVMSQVGVSRRAARGAARRGARPAEDGRAVFAQGRAAAAGLRRAGRARLPGAA
jgi:hypothetical protein